VTKGYDSFWKWPVLFLGLDLYLNAEHMRYMCFEC